MDTFDTIHFENIEDFLQKINWRDFPVPEEVISLIKEINSFETKSLDNSLENYLISLDGRLKSKRIEKYEYDDPFGNFIKSEQDFTSEYWIDEDFNGKLIIYPDAEIDFLDQDWFLNFELNFNQGLISSMKLIEVKYKSNKRRKRQISKIKEDLSKRFKILAKIESNFFLRNYYKFWVKPIDGIFNKMSYRFQSLIPIFRILRFWIIPFYSRF